MARTYTTWGKSPNLTRPASNGNLFMRLVASVMLALLIATSLMPASVNVAFADDGDKKTVEKLQEAQKQLGVTESGDKGFTQALDKAKKDGSKTSFAKVLNRVLTPSYIYQHPKSSTDGYYKDNKKWSCDANDPNKGLLTYHNCDVPNYIADLGQNLYSAVAPGGIQRGGAESNKLDMPWLGLPTGVKNVPATASARVEKYTAMELYGYNLRVTYYNGEFDHIQVQTEARLMGNFGASQTLALGINAIFNGATEGVSGAYQAFKDEWAKGNPFGSVAAAFTAGAQTSAAAAIDTILDTSDANVMATRGYARVGIDNTLYNARAATNAEMEQEIVNTIAAAIAGKTPEEVRLPDDLKQLQTPPSQPSAGGTTCIVTNPDGTKNTISKLADENACSEAAKTANMENPQYQWDASDKQAESIKDWKEHNKGWFEAAQKYSLTCNVNEDEAKRDETLSAFYSCVPTAYTTAVQKYTKEKEGEAGKKLAETLKQPGFFQDFLKKNVAANFNSPTNQYYCLNIDGTDKLDANGKPMKLFTANGAYNPDCTPTRAPIKGGIYGTGDGAITDTRRELYDSNLASMLFSSDGVFTDFTNAGIMSAAAVTRLANAALNIGMSPLLQTFGVDNLIAELITLFTKSAFYPFGIIAALIGLLLIVRESITKGNRGIKTLAMFILGLLVISTTATLTLNKPHETIKFVDKSVNVLDSFIADALVSKSIGDEICSATGNSGVIKYATKRTDSDPATRTLMCEVWRMNVLTPWSYAQWGTGYNNLYAVDAKRPTTAHTLTNTNSAQVSRAPVQMGAGITVNNWALYQLDLMSTGTTTEDNPNRPAGITSRDMYRIVDVQAGLDNGAGTDSRYLQHWAGREAMSRASVGALAPIAAIVTGFAVGYFAVYKAIIKAILLLMLVLLPFILLMALLGKRTKQGTMRYVTTILGLYAQSAILTFLLCLMSVLLINLTSSVTAYIFVFIAQTLLSLLLLLGARKIMKKIMGGHGIAGTINMTDSKHILSKTKVGKQVVRFFETAPGKAKHNFAKGYAENGLRGGITEAAKTVTQLPTINPYNRKGAVRTVLTARSTGLETARKSVQDMDGFDEAKKIARDLNEINAAEHGVKASDNSIDRLRSVKDIRNAKNMVTALQEAKAEEKAAAEQTVQERYEAQKNYVEQLGGTWKAPEGKEHEANVQAALEERKRSSEAAHSMVQETVEKQSAQSRTPKDERFDIQNDTRFTPEEKAIHKVAGKENTLRYAAKSVGTQAANRFYERFLDNRNTERITEAFQSGYLNGMPEEVENALTLTEEQLNDRPLEELERIQTWLRYHKTSQSPDEHKRLLEVVEKLISYKKRR